ncbi:histidine acid phosphatase [Parathielavia appendiculata]|uniref:Histidine acid phosphatase n=1 Tax=Parathielavia appendiculata TaxID=2587402 RepID=A0AAN6U3C0_9PEZI|nr:histidine acid phosphatase [Parathielavia appendiculata]
MLLQAGHVLLAFAAGGVAVSSHRGNGTAVDLSWHPPKQTQLNNLTAVVNGDGVYGFIYNSSDTPDERYGVYNWCNMPHVRKREYVKAPREYELVFVEVIHRHHKRTPYSSNAFPVEPYQWNCDDQGLYYHGEPFDRTQRATPAYWKGYTSEVNPFVPSGWIGTCQFPQITADGMSDSWQHGEDLYAVYHNLLNFLPDRNNPSWRHKIAYRVTRNTITSQVAGMLIHGMWRTTERLPLLIQADAVDSLEPKYSCPAARDLSNKLTNRDANPAWAAHLDAAKPLYAELDTISGVPASDAGFHASLDHYYDNLSARQCHQKPLPCGGDNNKTCVTQDLADRVYRFGHWEYNHVYRGSRETLAASAAAYGVWIAELAAHLRGAMVPDGNGNGGVIYFHNIAHDGSVSRLLSVLQLDEMVWPGMGSEVVFELFRKREGGGGYFVRVLFGGRVLTSSNPSLGVMDMLPVATMLAYFDGLVGEGAKLVVERCDGSVPL